MTPEQAILRREKRIDALIDRVEAGEILTGEDWLRLDQLNSLDVLSVSQGAAREILELEKDADGFTDGILKRTAERPAS